MDWRIAHDAFVAYAAELPDGSSQVRVLGIDETGRGKGRYEVELSTGMKVWLDRFGRSLYRQPRDSWHSRNALSWT